ncbi:MAG TPA: hypothetical protein VMD52_06910, partial [Patescibacteria group bacterium]|nr:hypothetical protein [Patescibacteria group bacterium]
IFLSGMLQEPAQDKSSFVAPFVELADHFSKGTEAAFYHAYDYNVYPVSDDSPFFYQYNKWHSNANKNFMHSYYDKARGLWHIFILSSLLVHSLILSFVLILLPLAIARKNTGTPGNRFFVFAYFMSIGFGFMLLEMSIVQKFVLFLGSPIYSMAVTVPAILIFAGLGSLYSGRMTGGRLRYVCGATFACGALILLLAHFMPAITGFFLLQPLPVRVCAVILTIAPLAFCMGLPFPLALRSVSSACAELVPWAWAVNGASSVIASIVAIIIAMQYGFKTVLSVSAIFYFMSSMAALFYRQRPAAG